MQFTLTADLSRFIKHKLTTGLYASEVEVVREALLLLEARDEYRAIRLDQLRREIGRGAKAADKGKLVRGAKVLRELRKRNRRFAAKRG